MSVSRTSARWFSLKPCTDDLLAVFVFLDMPDDFGAGSLKAESESLNAREEAANCQHPPNLVLAR